MLISSFFMSYFMRMQKGAMPLSIAPRYVLLHRLISYSLLSSNLHINTTHTAVQIDRSDCSRIGRLIASA